VLLDTLTKVLRIIHLAIVAVLVAIALSAAGRNARASCLPLVKYKGHFYTGYPTNRTLKLRGRLAGVVPPCNDMPGGPPEPDRPTRLAAVAGVAPGVAVGKPVEPRIVYIRFGLFPAVRTFPLHRAIFGAGDRPNECSGMRLLRTVRLTGTVDAPSTFVLALRTKGRSRQILVDARTRLGYPVTRPLRKGEGLVVSARDCMNAKTRLRVLVAARISLRPSPK
jgi:hypothetical protein